MKPHSRWSLVAAAVAIAAATITTTQALGRSTDQPGPPGSASGLGQLSGLLPRDNLTLGSAIQVDLSKETVRLPLYRAPPGSPASSPGR
jgi:hypothetical protein